MKRFLLFLKPAFVTLSTVLVFGHVINAQSTTEFVFRNPVLISGIADQDGAVYKFTNVAPGIDANVTVMGRSGPEVFLDTVDIPLSNGMGYDKALQPQVGLHGTAPANTSWWLKMKVNFVKSGTNHAIKVDNFVASAIDVDGDNVSITENITMFKANSVKTSISSVLSSLLPIAAICPKHKLLDVAIDCLNCSGLGYTVKSNGKIQNCGKCNNVGKLFALCGEPWIGSDIQIKGTTFNALGIDTLAFNNMATFSYANTDEVIFSYGATTGASASSAGQRLNSLWFKSFNYSISGLLAVQLTDFSAIAQHSTVDLRWAVGDTKEVSSFLMERSIDGIQFKECATIFPGSKTNVAGVFKYTDQAPEKTNVSYYRLRMVDIRGIISYSGIKSVVMNSDRLNSGIVAYPNPANNQVHISTPASWTGKKATAFIYNTAGILVKTVQLNTISHVENLDVSQLATGLYTISLKSMDVALQTKILIN